MKNITDELIERIEALNNPTVAGLDPRLEYLPESLQKLATSPESAADAILEFNCRIIDEIKDVVPAVKIQSAFYELYSYYGVRAMEQTAAYAKKNGLITMADVKRNDIGSTAEAYAAAYLKSGLYDYITVNPYPGYDGIKPFTDVCESDGKGIFVLARMSNPSAAQLQNIVGADGKPLYIRVGELISEWGASTVGKYGYSAVGAVVGATNPDEARSLRKTFKSVFFLVPGYGAQGGKGKDAAASFDENGRGAIVNNSRGIIAAYKTDKYKGLSFAKAAREAAIAMQQDLKSALGK
ncbi:MAG: orotidine-5'-phosphate decarboxylase [Clostridiales bacterium]|nr:orotidine-5'-phosphate decarboxylase [Clostridiales bacterium]